MQLLGRELAISRQKEDAVAIKGFFSRIGAENAELFGERFKGEFCDLDAALGGVQELSVQFFDAAVKRANDLLISYEISSFTRQSLTEYLKNNGYFSFWEDSLNKFEEKNNAIDQELKSAGDTRKAAAKVVKSRVFDLMEPCLTKAMRHTTEGFAPALMSIITEEKGLTFAAPTLEEISRSKEIYNNVISGKVPEKERVDAVFDAITLNPGNCDAFYFLVLRYGDSDCEIEKAGEHFGNPIGQKKLEGVVSYQKKAFQQTMDSIAALEGEEYVKALETLRAGFSNIKRNMGISPDLITQPEKDLEKAIQKGREKAQITIEPAPEAKNAPETEPSPETKNATETELATEIKNATETEPATEEKPEPEPVQETEEQPEIKQEPPHVGRSKLTMQVHESLLPEAKLQQIKDLCSRFKAEAAIPGLYEPTKKLMHYLELEDDEEIYLGHDKTILSSGKDGFAITNYGIICVSGKEANEMPYSELATVRNLKWANNDFKFDLMADGSTLIKCLPSDKDDILGLVDSIRQIVVS